MDEKEKQIVERTHDMFMNYGIKSVTMDDISNKLSISKKTLYQYVKDKTELVQKVMIYEFQSMVMRFDELYIKAQHPILEMINVNIFINEMHSKYKPSMMYDLKKYYPEVHCKHKDERRQRMFNIMVKNLKTGKEMGLYREDMNEDVIAKLHMVRYESLIGNDLFSFEEVTSADFVNEIFKYHIHGILNEKGLKYYNDYINKK